MATPKKKSPGEKAKLLAKLARQLGATQAEVELRALREFAERLEGETSKAKPSEQRAGEAAGVGGLPRRLYLLLDGRGLDGRGLPVEIIDVPAIVGSGKRCSVWVNSPNIETRHLQISQDGSEWVLEDLGSEAGTFLDGARVSRRTVRHGDEYKLAGYLRLRTELR